MKRFIASLVLCGVLLSSCTVTREVSMKDDLTKLFVGLKHHEIIKIMGAPSRETSDGLGGMILVYEDVVYESLTKHFGASSFINTTSSTSYIHHYLNKEGTCYKIETNYMKTKEDESASTTLGIIGTVFGVIALAASVLCVSLNLRLN